MGGEPVQGGRGELGAAVAVTGLDNFHFMSFTWAASPESVWRNMATKRYEVKGALSVEQPRAWAQSTEAPDQRFPM